VDPVSARVPLAGLITALVDSTPDDTEVLHFLEQHPA
jgi:hypothetical protein